MRSRHGIADDSMLRSRAARDAMEHLDERIDRWCQTSSSENSADRDMASPGAIAGIHPRDYARHHDPETHALTIVSESLDSRALISEVDALISAVRQRHDEEDRPPPRAEAPLPDIGAPPRVGDGAAGGAGGAVGREPGLGPVPHSGERGGSCREPRGSGSRTHPGPRRSEGTPRTRCRSWIGPAISSAPGRARRPPPASCAAGPGSGPAWGRCCPPGCRARR